MSESHDNVVMKSVKAAFSAFAKVAPEAATKILFRKYLGYPLDLKHPKTLNEKMQYLKLKRYKKHPLVTSCADKFAVRDYVKTCGLEDTLVPLLGVWENPEDIDFDALPDRFVLKCNHGSGGNIFCTDKSKFDREDAVKKLSLWMSQNFGQQRAEMSYCNITKKIIAEEYIETSDGIPPKDYKIFCSYGEPKFLFVASDRYEGNTKFDYFTLDWNWLPVQNCHPNAGPDRLPRPEGLDRMLECAQQLSKPFPLVRADFYYENGKVLFGELTFLHFGGLAPFTPASYDRIFGDLIDSDITQGILEDRIVRK